MKIINIIIPIILVMIILQQLRYIKTLKIPMKKRYIELFTMLTSVIVLGWIMYTYAQNWGHYIIGALGILTFISSCVKEGISSKGFVSMYKYKQIILWNEIKKVSVISSKNIKVKLFGGFMEQSFYFKKSDYDKVIAVIKENLPVTSELEILNK